MERIYATTEYAAGWDPSRNCWVYRSLYWERGFAHDVEWQGDDCYISRVEMCLWAEARCLEQDKSLNLTEVERTRKLEQKYVQAERVCKGMPPETWTEAATVTEAVEQEWNLDSEFWEDIESE